MANLNSCWQPDWLGRTLYRFRLAGREIKTAKRIWEKKKNPTGDNSSSRIKEEEWAYWQTTIATKPAVHIGKLQVLDAGCQGSIYTWWLHYIKKKKKKNLQEGNCRELRVRRANWLDIKAESPKSNSLWERKEKKKKNWYCLRPYQQASNGSGFFCFNHEHGQVERWRMLARWNQSIGGRARVCSKGRSIYRDWYIYTCTTANIYVRVCKRKGKGKKKEAAAAAEWIIPPVTKRGAHFKLLHGTPPHRVPFLFLIESALFPI